MTFRAPPYIISEVLIVDTSLIFYFEYFMQYMWESKARGSESGVVEDYILVRYDAVWTVQ